MCLKYVLGAVADCEQAWETVMNTETFTLCLEVPMNLSCLNCETDGALERAVEGVHDLIR